MYDEILSLESIARDYQGLVAVQEYGKKPVIEGARLIDLRLMTDDGGLFLEIARFTEGCFLEAIPEFRARQASYSLVLPGAIKAFHLHFRQDDVWFVPPGDRLLAGLVDVRAESPTKGVSLRIPLGGNKSQLLFIPRGVAHGVANLGTTPSAIFYFVSQKFEINDPDERRIPYDFVGREFWNIQPG